MRVHTSAKVLSGFLALTLLPASVLGLASPASAASTRPDISSAPADASHIIVKFKDDAGDFAIHSASAKQDLTDGQPLEGSGATLYEIASGADPTAVAKSLVRSGSVEYAEPDYTVTA